jgi:hypothetical protein
MRLQIFKTFVEIRIPIGACLANAFDDGFAGEAAS